MRRKAQGRVSTVLALAIAAAVATAAWAAKNEDESYKSALRAGDLPASVDSDFANRPWPASSG